MTAAEMLKGEPTSATEFFDNLNNLFIHQINLLNDINDLVRAEGSNQPHKYLEENRECPLQIN